MRNIFLVLFIVVAFINLNAQRVIFSDNFDTNNMGWNEIISKEGEAIIKDGVLSIISKDELKGFQATCLTNLNVKNNFTLTCDVLIKNIDNESNFGLIIDYLDDYNYKVFGIYEGNAFYRNVKDGKIVGYRSNTIKLKSKRNTNASICVEKKGNSMILSVNEIEALEVRPDLQYNGIGFFVSGKQKVSFDNLEIKQ